MRSRGKKNRNIPEFVFINIDSMKTIRKTLKIPRINVARSTNLSRIILAQYEIGIRLPSQKSYNALANFFDWEIWE